MDLAEGEGEGRAGRESEQHGELPQHPAQQPGEDDDQRDGGEGQPEAGRIGEARRSGLPGDQQRADLHQVDPDDHDHRADDQGREEPQQAREQRQHQEGEGGGEQHRAGRRAQPVLLRDRQEQDQWRTARQHHERQPWPELPGAEGLHERADPGQQQGRREQIHGGARAEPEGGAHQEDRGDRCRRHDEDVLHAEEQDPPTGPGLVHGVHGTRAVRGCGGGAGRYGSGVDGMYGTGHARAPFARSVQASTIRPWTAASMEPPTGGRSRGWTGVSLPVQAFFRATPP